MIACLNKVVSADIDQILTPEQLRNRPHTHSIDVITDDKHVNSVMSVNSLAYHKNM